MSNTEQGPKDGSPAPTLRRDHLKTSLLIGALLTLVWMFVVLVAGAWPLSSTEHLRGLLNAALNNLVNLTVLIFLIQALWVWVRSRRSTS